MRLCLTALACALCATAMAQQTPLTGRMLGNQPQATGNTAPPAPPQATPTQPEPAPPSVQPATTYPAHPMHSGQPTSSTPPPTPHAPMPAYTDMQTLGPQPVIADTDIEPRDAVFGTPIGGTTEHLLQMQASNRSAGPAKPMLGDEAAAAYKRYIDSFKHPIPEFFQTNVESNSGSGGGGQ